MGGVLRKKMLAHQMKMIYTASPFPALVSGFGGGKSECLVMKSLKQMFEIENAQIAIYEPTVDLIRKIMYPRFEEILSDAGIVYNLNKSDGIITIHSIGTIIFRSLENPERIIGYEVHHSHVDELDTLGSDKAEAVWQKLLGRNRKRIILRPSALNKKNVSTKNSASVYTTPEGFGFVFNRWKKNPPNGYELIQASTYDNPYLPKEYIETLKESYSEQLISAYLEGKFVNLESGTVYPNYDPVMNNCYDRVASDYESIHIGMDFNVNHMSAVVGVLRFGKLLILEEITDVRDTPAMIDEIGNSFDTGRNITIYPDASGRSVKSVDASRSDIALLKEAGYKVLAPKKNPPVRNRIVSMNSSFKNAKGQMRLLINSISCPNLSANLIEQAYDKNGAPLKTNNVDHLPDALGYLVHRLFAVGATRGRVKSFRL